MAHHITSLVDRVNAILATHGFLSKWPSNRVALTTFAAAVLGLAAPVAYRDYRSYLALGPGGPPYNVIGWLFVKLFVNPFRREVFSTDIYDRKVLQGETVEFLKDLPKRNGERPTMGSFAVPHRQVNQIPSQEVKNKLEEKYQAFLVRNSHLVDRVPSILERHTDAAHVSKNIPLTSAAEDMHREICHLHGTSDYSVHVTLAPADCKRVIESGWGQRFTLAGSSLFKYLGLASGPKIPFEYMLIYAPRSDEEIEVVMQIIKASVGYMTDSTDLK
ncbi:hypothetical protein ARAM_002297 [Aspergillus rambellii]|uniref:Luciferase domain-containing protein n=2 Tax=Aspergillus subgen. Nidulantes TaxID=2720870 RepID=A0A0F8XV69_9EURO|nr:hypothetical protein AOCH_004758 [Aspergillus ochraceoroseus]KKK27382.1 hypothetical protein ARAM_002297 [Aspergillus rambellii]